jgi:peptidoglycan/LPS O-acetylase OafA/YrhL
VGQPATAVQGQGSSQDSVWAVRRRYFPAVEGMRGVAALLVLGGHVVQVNSLPESSRALTGYWIAVFGVVVFFTISGFLLYRPFLAARATGRSVAAFTPSYLWRRAVRIFPAYWVAITVLAIWPGLEGIFSEHWWRYYLLIQTYWPVHYGLPVAWTLCVEVAFYVALPLIAIFLASRGVGSGRRHALSWELLVLLGLAVFSLAWRGGISTKPSLVFLGLSLLGTFSWFATGMLLAVAQVAHPSALRRFRRLLAQPLLCWPLAVAIFALVPLLLPDNGAFDTPGPGVVVAQTVALGLAGLLAIGPSTLGDGSRLVTVALANRGAVFLGTISYGIYLWHYQVLTWLIHQVAVLELPAHLLSIGLLALTISVGLATASWFLIEKPLMRRARSVKAFTKAGAATGETAPSVARPAFAPDSRRD